MTTGIGNQRGSIHNDNSVSDRSQQIKTVKALEALEIQIDPIVLHYEERKGKFYFCPCCRKKNVDFTTRANSILHLSVLWFARKKVKVVAGILSKVVKKKI